MHVNFFSGYVFYYVCGYWIRKHPFIKKEKYMLILIFLGCWIFVALGTDAINNTNGVMDQKYYDNLFILTAVESICIFCFFSGLTISGRFVHINSKLADSTFGVFLLHELVIEVLNKILVFDADKFPVLFVLSVTIFVFLISNCIVTIGRKNKFIRKYVF